MFFRLRRAEAASAVWIPHWHSEPCESQGTRAAKRYVNGNLGFRNLLGARRGLRGQFSVQSDNRFSGRGGGWGGVASVLKKIVRLHRFFVHHISLESKLDGWQKAKGGHGSITASISTSLIASLIASLITLNLGVGCAPSCWPIFGFRTSWVLAGGSEGSFLCSLITDFLAEG